MAYTVTATMATEIQKVAGAYPIDMYMINASLTGYDPYYYVNLNQDVYGWDINASGDVVSSTVTYNAANIQREAIHSNISGEISGLNISVPNVDRTIEALIQNSNYLRGCEVHILTTFAQNLPSSNPGEEFGEHEDYRSVFHEKFYIDSVTSNEEVVTFTCKSKFDIKSVVVPGRTFSRECQWVFKDSNCGYSGAATSCDYSLKGLVDFHQYLGKGFISRLWLSLISI